MPVEEHLSNETNLKKRSHRKPTKATIPKIIANPVAFLRLFPPQMSPRATTTPPTPLLPSPKSRIARKPPIKSPNPTFASTARSLSVLFSFLPSFSHRPRLGALDRAPAREKSPPEQPRQVSRAVAAADGGLSRLRQSHLQHAQRDSLRTPPHPTGTPFPLLACSICSTARSSSDSCRRNSSPFLRWVGNRGEIERRAMDAVRSGCV